MKFSFKNKMIVHLTLLGLIFGSLGIASVSAAGIWETVGLAGFSVGRAPYTSLDLDSNDAPYVAYADGGNSGKATVMKFNGSAWETVGPAGFSAGGVSYTSLDLDSNDAPYVAYADGGNSYKATVMKFNGSAWETVGSAGFSAGEAYTLSLALDSNNTPYLAYRDKGNFDKTTVMKFNGSDWETVGFSAGRAYNPSLALDSNNTPYVAYRDWANSLKATVMKFNGSAWEIVGLAGFSAGGVYEPSLALDSNNIPYVAFSDASNSGHVTVVKFNGSAWETVGSAGFSARGVNAAYYISLAFDSHDMPYVAYQDWTHSGKATVMKYSLTYTVTFNANGGYGTLNDQTASSVTALNTNTFTRPGYAFSGWNTAANGSGTAYADGASYDFTTDITLYAQWTLSPTFVDVPADYWAWQYIESLYSAGITGGCSSNPLSYCPDQAVTRAQMAVFILKGIHGRLFVPSAATGNVFGDVLIGHWAAAWIEQFASEGITAGCGNGNYCPDQAATTRAQMAVFLLRAKYG
ncbi:MAG: InlB B-repeat-containing protein, partial [Anaerolineales bacterium]|nr:InlB B-repeat-containing protein [Anaerolineales bacterium]